MCYEKAVLPLNNCNFASNTPPSKYRFFEVHHSNAKRLLVPPRGSNLRVLTFLRENIDFAELGDPSDAKIASCQAILGPKWSKNAQKSIFRGPSF